LRTQNNMKKEHARNMLMLDHIESLRQQFSMEQAMAAQRKETALEQRKEREAKEAEELASANQKKAELDNKRQDNISTRETTRQEKNQEYCMKIRDMKTAQALRAREAADAVEEARDKTREEKTRERQFRQEQDYAAARVEAQREDNIRAKEQERDRKFASMVQDRKEREMQQSLDMESRKHQKRQIDKESAHKREEEEQQRKRQMAILEDQREQMIKQRALERNKREQERLKQNAPSKGASPMPQATPGEQEAAASSSEAPKPK